MTLKKKKIDSVLTKAEDEETSVLEADIVSNIPINIDIPKEEEIINEVKEPVLAEELPKTVELEEDIDVSPKENGKNYIRVVEIVAVVIFIIIVAGFSVTKWRENSKPVTYVAPDSGVVSASVPAVKEPVKESFVVQEIGSVVGNSKENIATADPQIFKPSTDFKTFSYDADAGKVVALSGACRDSYYVILIFEEGKDYRKEPSASRYNSAYPCPSGGRFSVDINLKESNLPSGRYYMFVADQGEAGSWYNPR